MFDLLKSLFNPSSQAYIVRERCLNQMLKAYHEEARSTIVIDSLEKDLSTKSWILPISGTNEELAITLEGAILSLQGRLLAFGAAAILLLLLSVSLKFQNQGPVGLEEMVTYNADFTRRDSFLFPDEVDYGH